MRKIMKKIRNGLHTLMALTVLAGIAAAVFCHFRGIRPYVVLSGSMEPAIQTGSLCFIDEHYPYESVTEQDIIAFHSPTGQLVTHRAIAISKDGIETKGDNNRVTDGITTGKANFAGKNLGSIPRIGRLIYYLNTPHGRIVAVSVLVCYVLLGDLLDTFWQPAQDQEKTDL